MREAIIYVKDRLPYINGIPLFNKAYIIGLCEESARVFNVNCEGLKQYFNI